MEEHQLLFDAIPNPATGKNELTFKKGHTNTTNTDNTILTKPKGPMDYFRLLKGHTIANLKRIYWENFNFKATKKGEFLVPLSLKQNDKNTVTHDSNPTRNLSSSRHDKIILEKHEENEENKQEADDDMNTSASQQNTIQQNTITNVRGEMPTSTKEANKPDLLNNNITTSDTIIMEPQVLHEEHHWFEAPSSKEKGEVNENDLLGYPKLIEYASWVTPQEEHMKRCNRPFGYLKHNPKEHLLFNHNKAFSKKPNSPMNYYKPFKGPPYDRNN